PGWRAGEDDRRRTIPPQHVQRWDMAVAEQEWAEPPTAEDAVRIQRARAAWSEAVDPRGTLAEAYLSSRALTLTDELAGHLLRFHSACPWRNENTGRTERIPALLAAFRSIDNDVITAVHRIRLDQPARWPKTERRMIGVVRRAAVKLAPAGESLAIGEGIETCMAAQQLGFAPAWALGSVGAIGFFPVIAAVSELVLLGETGGASATAIRRCGSRWQQAGRRV